MTVAHIALGSFEQGQPIRMADRTGVIKIFDEDEVIVRWFDGNYQDFTPKDFMRAFEEGRIHFVSYKKKTLMTVHVTKQQEKEIERRQNFCLPLRKERYPGSEDTLSRVIEETMDKNGYKRISPATLNRWFRAWREDGFDMSIQVVFKNKKRKARIAEEFDKVINDSIKKDYLNCPGPKMKVAYRKFRRRFVAKGYSVEQMPSYDTYCRRIKAWDPLEVIEAREGDIAKRDAEYAVTAKIRTEYPLHRVECDTAHFNIGLLNDQGHYVGMVSVYLAIDVDTRAILGFAIHVGRRKEDAACVVSCLTYAISRKNDPDYPMGGFPCYVIMDSGPGYKSEMTQKFVGQNSDGFDTTATYMGRAKPFVERFIGTMRTSFFDLCDGYLGKRDPKKYNKETVKANAKLTVGQFRKMLYDFIVNDYHHTEHSGLGGQTPYQAWMERIKYRAPIFPEHIDDISRLRGLRLRDRALQNHGGVFVNYQHFASKELQRLYLRLARTAKKRRSKAHETQVPDIVVDVLVDPLNAQAITVIVPDTGELLEVPNSDPKVPAVSFAELNAGRQPIGAAETPYFHDGTDEAVGESRPTPGEPVPLDDAANIDLISMLAIGESAASTAPPASTGEDGATDDEESEEEYDDYDVD